MYYAVQLYTSGQVNSFHEVVNQFSSFIQEPIFISRNFILGKTANHRKLMIDLDFEDWQNLVSKHDEAFKVRTLYETDNPYFPATLRADNMEDVKAEVRLKGASTHFMGGKWSLRVRIRDDDKSLYGLKTFSLQHPETRRYISEWLIHKIMKQEGIIALNYDFVEVIINGEKKGIYAMEEHFSKELLERNGRREGPIIVLSEELINVNSWQDVWLNENREVDSYQTLKTLADETLSKNMIMARSLIHKFQNKEMKTCEIFECSILAKYFALLDLMGAEHAAESGNMKMYYNPISSKLEPIIFDAEAEYTRKHLFLRTWSNYDAADSKNWIKNIFSDENFMNLYLHEISRISNEQYLDKFFEKNEREMNEKIRIIHGSYPNYRFNKSELYNLQKRIVTVLNARKSLDAYLNKFVGGNVELEIGNILPWPIKVIGVKCGDNELRLDNEVPLPALIAGESIIYSEFKINLREYFGSEDCLDENFEIIHNRYGNDGAKYEMPSMQARVASDFVAYDVLRAPPNPYSFNFIQVNSDSKLIELKKGRWTVNRNILLPSGFTVVAEAGFELNLTNNANFISYSPVEFHGKHDLPVVIESRDGSGGGVMVHALDGKSYLSHVLFKGLSAPMSEKWGLTGAVTFYEGELYVNNTQFVNNHDSDDALNVVRNKSELINVSFIDVESDGLDSDFSTGIIHTSSVNVAGGDGFDFSGSSFELNEVQVIGVGDKGISIGERSNITASKITVADSKIGVVSKDFSDADINGLQLNNIDIGLAVYQKKPEYGFGRMSVWNLSGNEVEINYLAEVDSILVLDALRLGSNYEDLGDEL